MNKQCSQYWVLERWFCETETSSPVIKFLCTYKRIVSDGKYYILFVNISTTGCPLPNLLICAYSM